MSGEWHSLGVMAGLVPAIHVFERLWTQDVDARDERGHDVERVSMLRLKLV